MACMYDGIFCFLQTLVRWIKTTVMIRGMIKFYLLADRKDVLGMALRRCNHKNKLTNYM